MERKTFKYYIVRKSTEDAEPKKNETAKILHLKVRALLLKT